MALTTFVESQGSAVHSGLLVQASQACHSSETVRVVRHFLVQACALIASDFLCNAATPKKPTLIFPPGAPVKDCVILRQFVAG